MRTIHVWDDLAENLQAFSTWKAQLLDQPQLKINIHDSCSVGKQIQKSLPTESIISYALCERGLARHSSFTSHAEEAIEFILSLWAGIHSRMRGLDISAVQAERLIRPFGSYLIGRESDVDLLLIGSLEHGSIWTWLKELESELQTAGVGLTYLGESQRCPRLACKLLFNMFRPIEFDLVIALVPEAEMQDPQLPQASDIATTVLSGHQLWTTLLQDLKTVGISIKHVADILTFVLEILRVSGLKGNELNCIPSFCVLRLLVAFFQTRQHAEDASVDTLTIEFLQYLCGLDDSSWQSIASAPFSYIPLMKQAFSSALAELEAGISHSSVHALLRARVSDLPSGEQEASLCVVRCACVSV